MRSPEWAEATVHYSREMVSTSHSRPSANAGTQGGQAESLYKLDSVAELQPSRDMSSQVEENLME